MGEAFSSGITPHYAFSLDEAFAAENEQQKCVQGSYTLEFTGNGYCNLETVFAAFNEKIGPMLDLYGCDHDIEEEFRIHLGIGLNDDQPEDPGSSPGDDGPDMAFRRLAFSLGSDGDVPEGDGPDQAFSQGSDGEDGPDEAFSQGNSADEAFSQGDSADEAFSQGDSADEAFNPDNAFAFSEPAPVTKEEAVKRICRTAWSSNPKFPFTMAARQKNPNFEQVYFNGGTDWNEQVQYSVGTANFRHLKTDAERVKYWFNGLGSTGEMQWPNYLTNFKPETCSSNTAYCCWPKDRQANDNNGNCATPYETKCVDKDPADNTDLCFMDLDRNDGFSGSGSIMYPGDNLDGEGPIHCHGFAWSNDEGHPSARYKANNLFFVSMYDHMYQRGYVKNTPGAPMCACSDQMPTVSRSDCTQIDVEETYKLTYTASTKSFTGEISSIEIEFNSCQGFANTNNDLAAYVQRLTRENHMTSEQRHHLYNYIVGKNRCDQVRKHYTEDKYGLTLGYNPGDQWTMIVGRDTFSYNAITSSLFRVLYDEAPLKIIYRICPKCDGPWQKVYYRRVAEEIPADYDLFHALKSNWVANPNEQNNIHYNLYSTFQDAVDQTNPWTKIVHGGNKGMPGDSGPNESKHNQWTNFNRGWGREDVAMYIMKNPSRTTSLIDRVVTDDDNINLGGMVNGAAAVLSTGEYIINANGYDIWGTSDSFYYINQEGSGDVTLTLHVLSLTAVHAWSKVGLQIRNSVDKSSRHASCLLSANYGVVYIQRKQAGGHSNAGSHTASEIHDVWLKLAKNGDAFHCYHKYSEEEEWISSGSGSVEMEDGYRYGIAASTHVWNKQMETVVVDYQVDHLGNFGSDYENLGEAFKDEQTDQLFEQLKDEIEGNYVIPDLP